MPNEPLIAIPHNADAERNIVGLLLLAPERVGEAAERIEPSQFYVPLFAKIFAAILELDGTAKPIDAMTVREVLASDNELENAGGVAFISKLSDGLYQKAPLDEYCRMVKESASLRRVLSLCAAAAAQITEGERCPAVLDFVGTEFESIREENRSVERGPVHVSMVAKELLPVLKRAADGKNQLIGTPTGYQDIDWLTAGWQSGDYDILAARPSAGKTALAIEFSLRQLRAGNPVVFFSLEMSREAIYQRMICREAGVNSQRLRCGTISSDDLKRILDAVARLSQMPLWIDDSAGLRASDLRWRLRSLCKRQGIKFAVVDYLQLLRSPGKDRFECVTNSSIELKAAAKEIGQLNGGTLLALSQLNRAGAGERPRLEHLRESGQLEQDGDVIFLLSDADDSANGQVQPSTKILDIAKQRNGPCHEVLLTFLPAVGGFESQTDVFSVHQ